MPATVPPGLEKLLQMLMMMAKSKQVAPGTAAELMSQSSAGSSGSKVDLMNIIKRLLDMRSSSA